MVSIKREANNFVKCMQRHLLIQIGQKRTEKTQQFSKKCQPYDKKYC